MIDSSQDPWMLSIDAFIAEATGKGDLLVQAVAEDVLARVKELTPVKTGYLRANWTIIKGGGAQAISGEREEDSAAVVQQLKAGDSFAIVNPVIYAHRVEFGFVGVDKKGRHYDQHGAHMLQQTVTELPQIIERAAARISSSS